MQCINVIGYACSIATPPPPPYSPPPYGTHWYATISSLPVITCEVMYD
jgi:hypothetical protein